MTKKSSHLVVVIQTLWRLTYILISLYILSLSFSNNNYYLPISDSIYHGIKYRNFQNHWIVRRPKITNALAIFKSKNFQSSLPISLAFYEKKWNSTNSIYFCIFFTYHSTNNLSYSHILSCIVSCTTWNIIRIRLIM